MTANQSEVISCKNVNGVESSSLGIEKDSDSVASPVQEHGQRGSGDKVGGSSALAKTVASNGKTSQETTASIALENVLLKASVENGPNARFAVNLCDSCITAIAQSIVAMQQGRGQESHQCLGFISERKRQILNHSLVLFVESLPSTDTIPTTASLSLLLGYVRDAIENSISQENHNQSGKSVPTRFRYCSKASRAERNAGCEGMEEKAPTFGDDGGTYQGLSNSNKLVKNNHPTVKPLALMRYLAKLTRTPTGGVVLDPFMGSGTTGLAAVLEGRDFIGIELQPEYMEIATARVRHALDEHKQPQQLELTEVTDA